MRSELIKPHHLARRAAIYVRQSTPHQVLTNQESLRLQYALRHHARELGWREADVDVIDADLGVSGAEGIHRAGFKELVARVALGEIGLVLSSEVTRLARNCSDWYRLLDVCGHRACLIGDRDGIYDAGSPDGRLLLGLKGTISELELHTLRARLTAGLLAKAERGALALMLPAGLERDQAGTVVKDPDREVQARLALVFDTFLAVRTAVRVARALRQRDLALPRRDRHGEVCWKRATIPAVVAILKNPAYAGAFVYGRTRVRPVASRPEVRAKARCRTDEWRIVVRDRYPAYVDWATFERIQAMLRDNRSEYRRIQARGVPRDGAALLHGIAWCGECGHKMMVRYKGGGQYVCNHLRQQHGAPECQSLRAAAIDARVAAAFLEAVAPAEIEAWERARQARRQAEVARLRAEAQQVERLRYRAALAERQFHRVDPDNRLVAAELERRWEEALGELRRAEEALERRTAGGHAAEPAGLDPQRRAALVAIGQRLPTLWADPRVGRAQRKALLRCLIDKVVLRRVARDRVAVRIVWRGGAVTAMEVDVPVNALAALSRHAELERRALELAKAGHTDAAVAALLTAEGYRSTRRAEVLPSTVRHIRHRCRRLDELGPPQRSSTPGWLNATEIAALLQVHPGWLHRRVRQGTIVTARDPATGRRRFPDGEGALSALRELRDGRLAHLDLTRA
jgi:DNA invertase Pin-like site-specific DNA recombinase